MFRRPCKAILFAWALNGAQKYPLREVRLFRVWIYSLFYIVKLLYTMDKDGK